MLKSSDDFEGPYSSTSASSCSDWAYADAFMLDATPAVRELAQQPTRQVALVGGTLGATAKHYLGDAGLWPLVAHLTGRTDLPDLRHPDDGLQVRVPAVLEVKTKTLPLVEMENVPTTPAARGVVRAFVQVQLQKQPDVRQVHAQLMQVLKGPHPPGTLTDLISTARTLADATVAPGFGGPQRPRWVMAVALIALGGLGLGIPNEARERFPQFLHDGRKIARGVDASWHVTTHLMFTYLFRLDDELGAGELKELLAKTAACVDEDGRASLVDRAYEQTKGSSAPLLPGSLPIGGDLGPSTYVPHPTDLSGAEQLAYDTTMRISNAYEHVTTYDELADYDPALLGQHPEVGDPFARFVFRLDTSRGLSEAAVCRDISANRIGTRLGIELFREPGSTPEIPFDVGDSWAGRPYEQRTKVPKQQWLAEQAGLLDVILGDDPVTDPTPQRILHRLDEALHEVSTTQPDKLPRVFANFVARQQRWLVPLNGRGQLSFDELERDASGKPVATLVTWAQEVFTQMLDRLAPDEDCANAANRGVSPGPTWVGVRAGSN